jgi:cytoplasmic iron level regulating protein YaaA (DUF328/UPF0246 family)
VLIILPPSETKRDGGVDGSTLDFELLSFSELTHARKRALAALTTLSRNLGASTGALGLGPTQRFEIGRNRAIRVSPTMHAIDRYTGVLYDGVDAPSLTPAARRFAAEHLVIHSALFGLILADDPIPAYRLSHNSRLPKVSLRTLWREPISQLLGSTSGLIVDLRSESYVALGSAPEHSVYVRVVSETADSRRVALSHFNKKSKGEFVRAVLLAGIDHGSLDSLLEWAAASGIRLSKVSDSEIELVV